MVDLTQDASTPGGDALETAIQTRVGDIESAKYATTTKSALNRFANWARANHDIEHPADITAKVLREYSRMLKDAVADENHPINTNSTAEQNYALVSAFLSWCVREELIDSNPATLSKSKEPLPESDEESNRQFWSERERKAICATTDQLVDDTLADEYTELEKAKVFRDRALVYTLAFTGCRGSELAAVPNDPKRNGLRWSSVDLDEGIAWVYGKNRTRQETVIFEPAIAPLQRWKQVLEPESTWPLFPTMHLPSLYNQLPADVSATPATVWDLLYEHECEPPPITVSGVRRLLARLCDESQYTFEETLKPHGARRGLGDTLYSEQAELAQEALRHQDIKTTHKAYREQKSKRIKEQGDELLGS